MKQLLILSGKGGTGKTTVAGAFIELMDAHLYADCDVDAPNLHLIAGIDNPPELRDYFGLPKAEINDERCISCGKCQDNCRFDAINFADGRYEVDPYACEGCGVCELICPISAVSMHDEKAGDLMLFKGQTKIFSTAKLLMGSGTSGMLVTEVKKQLKPFGSDRDIAVIDGSPGIGCPVIASLAGVDMVLIVTEPSLSGMSDLERIVRTSEQFGVPTAVCVNKFDINMSNTDKIMDYCMNKGIEFVGVIPYDKTVIEAVNKGLPITDYDCPAGTAVKEMYNKVSEMI